MLELPLPDLPGDWRNAPAPSSTKDYGTKLLRQPAAAVLKVPSAVIPQEYNYLINPLHPGISHCRIESVEDFVYDVRIKLV